MNKNITCRQCSNEFEGHHQRIYCDECNRQRQLEHERKRTKKRSLKKRKELDDNFLSLNPTGLQLLPKKFNEISNIKYQNYHNHFRMSWYDILKRYDKHEELKITLMDEYKQFYKDTGWQGFELFYKYMEISQELLEEFDLDEFRDYIGVKYNRITDEELHKNFLDVAYKLGKLPTSFKEFERTSEIDINTYRRRFNIKNNTIENIVKLYITNSEIIEEYLKDKKYNDRLSEEYRKKRIKECNSRNEQEIIETGREAVEIYLSEYGKLPTSRDFQDLTNGIGTGIIKQKFNMGYREFINYLGYSSKDYKYKTGKSTEKIVLDSVAKLLNNDYINQKTFEWLKGTKGWLLRCDGYFKDYNLVVEFDGRQHFEPVDFGGKGEEFALEQFKEIQINDHIKNSLIPQHGIKLLRIAYDEPYQDIDYLKYRLIEIGINVINCCIVSQSIINKLAS